MQKLNTNTQSCQNAVSSSYFDKFGNKIELHDILFYSEFDGENKEYHYADGIYLIVKIDGELYAKAKIITTTNAKSFINYDEEINNMLTLEQYCKNNISKEFVKIGNLKENKNMTDCEYANKTYSCL